MSNAATTETITIKGIEYVVVSREPAGPNVTSTTGADYMIGLRKPNGRKLSAAWTWPNGTIGAVFSVG